MTGENRRKNIAAEMTRGDESFESAELLLAAGKLADAVSRAYYAAFHYARALLYTLGEEARTHQGIERLLHRDLVREGKLDPDIARLFSSLQKFRQDADPHLRVRLHPRRRDPGGRGGEDLPRRGEEEAPGRGLADVMARDELDLAHRIAGGDEEAFGELVDAVGPTLVRLCRALVRNDAVAEEVVQETWAGILDSIGRFEGRSALKTWACRILSNTAKKRTAREARSRPVEGLGEDRETGVDPGRFGPEGFWAQPPRLPSTRRPSRSRSAARSASWSTASWRSCPRCSARW